MPNAHPPVADEKIGLLLVNLGTPRTPDAKGVRAYLKEFLSDRRVIELAPLIWQPILRGIILNTRPAKTAAAYAKIWRTDSNESPLRYFTRRQGEALQTVATQLWGAQVHVDWAMRYGTPSIESALMGLKARNCTRIAVIALYPQYSATTSASVYDEVFQVLKKMRWQVAIRTAAPWHDNPLYIKAIAQTITQHLAQLDWQPETLIASYHGLPQNYFDKGDPYYCHCAKTTRLLRATLNKSEAELPMTFQSRFGLQKWLTPYTSAAVAQLAQSGVKKIALVMPGFISDCLETLEEIDIALRDDFMAAGGTNFTTIPCLNDSQAAISLLAAIAERELGGWLT